MAENAVNTEQGVILEALNNKVDLNQLNTNNQGLSYVSGLGMPSDKYIDLTLGASGTQYTAPANGFFQLNIKCTANWDFANIVNSKTKCAFTSSGTNGMGVGGNIPVKKGDNVIVYYVGNVENFTFIYAQGESEE